MSRRHLRVLAFTLAAGAAHAAPAAHVYRADLDQSHWQVIRGVAACHLTHEIPLFGRALFTRTAGDHLYLTIYAERPPKEPTVAELFSLSPIWKRAAPKEIEQVRVRPEPGAFQFSDHDAHLILSELEAGRMPALRFDGWNGEGPTEVDLSSVEFREALKRYLKCVGKMKMDADAGAVPAPSRSNGERPAPSKTRYRETDASAQNAPTRRTGNPTGRAIGSLSSMPEPPEAFVYFVTDSTAFDRPALDTMRKFARFLKRNHAWSGAILIGHADSRGSVAHNRRLGYYRALRVREELVRLGVSPRRLQLRTVGEGHALASNKSRYGRSENRAVALKPVL